MYDVAIISIVGEQHQETLTWPPMEKINTGLSPSLPAQLIANWPSLFLVFLTHFVGELIQSSLYITTGNNNWIKSVVRLQDIKAFKLTFRSIKLKARPPSRSTVCCFFDQKTNSLSLKNLGYAQSIRSLRNTS